jgi:glycosyltransferase involved in cell wall biosynthesis
VVIAASRWLERFVYRHSDAIVVISDRFRERLKDRGVPEGKLAIVPNFAWDAPAVGPSPRHNAFSRTHGLDDAFVVLYAGNLGLTQDFETVLAAARQLEPRSDIRFVIVGDGARRDWIERRLMDSGARNITMLPYQASAVVPDLYGASDLCMIPLKSGAARTTFPSKIYTIMASERPAIVLAEPDSDVGRLVIDAGCGWRIDPGDVRGLVGAIKRALAEPTARRSMARAGRDHLLRHNTPTAAAKAYEEVFAELDRATAEHRSGRT